MSNPDPFEPNRVDEILSVGPTVGSCDDGRVSVGHNGTPCPHHPPMRLVGCNKRKWLVREATKTVRFGANRHGDCNPLSSPCATETKTYGSRRRAGFNSDVAREVAPETVATKTVDHFLTHRNPNSSHLPGKRVFIANEHLRSLVVGGRLFHPRKVWPVPLRQ